jgi:capsular polysaccharide transport system permease protein
MRYGREHFGFVWVVLEPMLLTVGVLVLWSILKGGYEHGVGIVEFVLTGYMLLTLWRHLTNHMILLFRRSMSLLYHGRISLFDIIYSKVLLEFTGVTAALLVVLFWLTLLGIISPVEDWSLFIAGWLLMAFLASGAGLIFLIVTENNESAEKFIQPVQYLLVPISGVFFMVDWLPQRAQWLILLNPMVHAVEILRSGFFGPSVEVHFSVIYIFAWGIILNFLGLVGVQRMRRDLQIV